MASRDVQIEKFHDLKIPIVNFEREENTEAITIQCDNEQGGALAASHLVGLRLPPSASFRRNRRKRYAGGPACGWIPARLPGAGD